MIQVRYKVDYSSGVYGAIQDVFANHYEIIRGLGELIDVQDDTKGKRTYLVGFENADDGWTARGLADEVLATLRADGWPVDMERV